MPIVKFCESPCRKSFEIFKCVSSTAYRRLKGTHLYDDQTPLCKGSTLTQNDAQRTIAD